MSSPPGRRKGLAMTSLGKRLIQSAQEAVAIARGEADPSTYRVFVPDDIDVRAIRTQLGLTQEEFSRRFGFAVKALRDWEQKRRRPDTAARAYLLVISREPDMVMRTLGGSQADESSTRKAPPARARSGRAYEAPARKRA